MEIRPNIQKLIHSPTLEIHERILRLRAEGKNVYQMGFGQSPFPVHPAIQRAVGIHADKNQYLPTAGLPDLRRAARDYYVRNLGLEAEHYEIIIGPGSKELIFDTQLAVKGDLLLPIPSWVSYAPQAELLGDRVIKIPTSQADNYHITPVTLEAAIQKARLEGREPRKLILNYPNNPTGLSPSRRTLEEVGAVCRKYGLLVIADEIYGLVHHQNNHISIARYYPEGTIVTSALSKHQSLGGYRLGVALFPHSLRDVFDSVVRIGSETWTSASAPIQYAAIKAFENDPEIEVYRRNCTQIHGLVANYVRDRVIEMGVVYPELQGAFYLYPDFERFRARLGEHDIETSDHLAIDLLERARLAVLPGTAFGDDPDHLRLRLATCDFDGQEALDTYTTNPDMDNQTFVDACCPRVVQACDALETYLTRE